MSESVVRLTFPAKPDYLLLARLALSGVARATSIDDEQLADLKLAVTEACGNVVRHAYPGEIGPVGVVFALRDDRLVMSVEDQGEGMETALVRQPLPETPIESGMGMSIIRTIVDEIAVESGADGRGTLVRMTKYLSPDGSR